jgi:hypothetical protein
MDTFKYSKFGFIQLYVFLGAALAFDLWFLFAGLYLVWPSQGGIVEANFGWWVPIVAIAAFIAAVFFFVKIRQFRKFFVGLSEEVINVNGKKQKWENLTQIEIKVENNSYSRIIMTSRSGNTVEIPGLIDSIHYIKGFVQGHAKNARITGNYKPPVEYPVNAKALLGLLQGWKNRGYNYSQRFGFMYTKGSSKATIDNLLGEAESYPTYQEEAQAILAKITGWKKEGKNTPQLVELLSKEGFGAYAANLFLGEVDRPGILNEYH